MSNALNFAPYQDDPEESRGDTVVPSSPGYLENQGERINSFDTSLPLRLDIEALLAYLFPPVTGVLMLVFERKNDYVRFHAWQSALVFSCLLVFHLIFSFSTFLSWVLFVGDIVLIIFLGFHAYTDAPSLTRYEVPYMGQLANEWNDYF